VTSSLGPWFDYTINGLVVGNIYALLAVGLALIYGVSHLINFAHGSIYMVGAYIGWLCITYLGTPLPVTLLAVVAGCALLGMAIERVGLRPLQGSPRIAPLLSTIGIGLVLDQVVQLMFTPDPRGVPLQLPDWRIQIGGGTIGALDILIAGIGLVSGLALYLFLRFTRLGWAVRATALDRDAAQQCGVDLLVERLHLLVRGHAGPDGVRKTAPVEAADSVQSERERRMMDAAQRRVNVSGQVPVDLADEAQGKMQLVVRLPARAADSPHGGEKKLADGRGRTDGHEQAVHRRRLAVRARKCTAAGADPERSPHRFSLKWTPIRPIFAAHGISPGTGDV